MVKKTKKKQKLDVLSPLGERKLEWVSSFGPQLSDLEITLDRQAQHTRKRESSDILIYMCVFSLLLPCTPLHF